ncbi:MAG TPA: type II secretion system F family protein [Candidatus Omnitrophica bacterium]|nr:type II secretion system F family protein [Candidatus Omnitrophota bacterium]
MSTYKYKAVDAQGKYTSGKIKASSESEIEDMVSKQGLTLVSIQEVSQKSQLFSSTRKVTKIKNSSLINFTYQLGTYIDSGVPLLSALHDLSKAPEDPGLSTVVFDLYSMIEKGFSFEESLKSYPKIFNSLYIGTVRRGETTGNLADVLKYLARYLEWSAAIRSQVKQAMIYPAILLIAIGGAVILLVTFVFPKFVGIFEGMNIELPLSTKMLIGLSKATRSSWKVMLVGLAAIILSIKFYLNTSQGRYLFDKLKLRLPLFGILLKKVAVSRFAHTFSMSLKSGIDVLRALDLCIKVVGNRIIESDISSVRDKVNVGENLANAFKETKEFPPLVTRLVSVGESSGTLEETVNKVAEYYDTEVPKTINQVFTMMEPLLLVVMGIGVGFVAFSIFVPLFSMVNVVKMH